MGNDQEGRPKAEAIDHRAEVDKVSLIDLDLHLNTREFAHEAVNQLLNLCEKNKSRNQKDLPAYFSAVY